MAELVQLGNTGPAVWRAQCFPANCLSVDDIRGDEYSEVTYSTQRATARDENKHAVGLSACVSSELSDIIMHNHWTKPVVHHTNSLFAVNILFQTFRYCTCTRWQHFPNNVTYTYNIFQLTVGSPRALPAVSQRRVSHELNVSSKYPWKFPLRSFYLPVQLINKLKRQQVSLCSWRKDVYCVQFIQNTCVKMKLFFYVCLTNRIYRTEVSTEVCGYLYAPHLFTCHYRLFSKNI